MISYNKANLERVEQNESRQQNRQQTVSKTVGRTKRRKNCYHENLRNIDSNISVVVVELYSINLKLMEKTKWNI